MLMPRSRALSLSAAGGILAALGGCRAASPAPSAPTGMPEYPPAPTRSAKPDEPATSHVLKAAGNGDELDKAASPVAAPPSKNCCKGKNDCKGKGNCKTARNACKGQNACKGRGGCRPAGPCP